VKCLCDVPGDIFVLLIRQDFPAAVCRNTAWGGVVFERQRLVVQKTITHCRNPEEEGTVDEPDRVEKQENQ
jgi:hypothetical protein